MGAITGTFEWLAGVWLTSVARVSCRACWGAGKRVDVIEATVWRDHSRPVAKRLIIKAWKAHMGEAHPDIDPKIPRTN